jgi:hypothetical protein
MPAGRPGYAGKLLEIFSAPFNHIIMLTTYRREWLPDEIFEKCQELVGRKAWLVCVDAEKDEKNQFKVRWIIPIREVEITDADNEIDVLNIWVKTKGYIDFDEKYLNSFKKNLKLISANPIYHLQEKLHP